jgi:hypothetical protein
MNQNKVLCTGNPSHRGIGEAVKQWFPDADFVSRSNGYDLTTPAGLQKLKHILSDYDILINNSYCAPGVQLKILELAHEVDFVGNIFTIGSMAEFKNLAHIRPDYSLEKQQLRDRSIELLSEHFKTTHLTVSGFKDRGIHSDDQMDAIEIVKAIQWVMNTPVTIPHLSLVDLKCMPTI